MTVTIRGSAETDLEEAFDYYESKTPGLGGDFVFEFRRAVDRILQSPRAWQPMDATFRRCRLHRFPYGIVYRIDEQSEKIVIVAVHHLHRVPGSWRR